MRELITATVGLVIVATVVIGLGRMAWRLLRGHEQMEAGGSMSNQIFGAQGRHNDSREPQPLTRRSGLVLLAMSVAAVVGLVVLSVRRS